MQYEEYKARIHGVSKEKKIEKKSPLSDSN